MYEAALCVWQVMAFQILIHTGTFLALPGDATADLGSSTLKQQHLSPWATSVSLVSLHCTTIAVVATCGPPDGAALEFS